MTLHFFKDIELEVKLNKVVLEGDIEFIFGYNINSIYNKFFKLNLPNIEIYFESDSISISFNLNIFLIDIELCDFPKDLWENYIDNDPSQSSGYNIKLSGSDHQSTSYIGEIFLGIGDSMGQCGLFLAIIAAIYGISEKSGYWYIKYGAIILGGFILVFEVITFIITTFIFESDPLMESAALLGYGIGCLISGIAVLIGVGAFRMLATLLTYAVFFEAFDTFFDSMGLKIGFLELMRLVPENDIFLQFDLYASTIIGGLVGLMVGILAWRTLTEKDVIADIISVVYMIVGIVLIRYSLKI